MSTVGFARKQGRGIVEESYWLLRLSRSNRAPGGGACVRSGRNYLCGMPAKDSPISLSRRGKSSRRLAGAEINSRLTQIELATVSSLRALQMDIDGDEGVPAAAVLKKARAALR